MLFDVGMRIRVRSHHWRRAHHLGTIVELDIRRGRVVIRFDEPGYGYSAPDGSDEGHFLMLDEKEIDVVTSRASALDSIRTPKRPRPKPKPKPKEPAP